MFMAQLAQLIPVMGSVIFSLDIFTHYVRGIALYTMRDGTGGRAGREVRNSSLFRSTSITRLARLTILA
jgi:hypothetical protein